MFWGKFVMVQNSQIFSTFTKKQTSAHSELRQQSLFYTDNWLKHWMKI